MTPTPISPPGGGEATPAQSPGNLYVASGNCSGTAFSHQQTIYISYATSAESTLAGTWLPSAGGDVQGLACYINLSYTDSLNQFSTSAVNTSACDNAANARDMHVLNFSALQHTGDGLGSSGYIDTSANGFTRRWQEAGDVEQQYWWGKGGCWFPLDSITYTAMQTNQTVAKAVIRSMVERIAAGGVQWTGGPFPPQFSPQIPKFDTSLIYI